MPENAENEIEQQRKRAADEMLGRRLADLNRRWNDVTYEERMAIVFDIDREYRAYVEGRIDPGRK